MIKMNKLFTITMVSALTIALTGCGGGGSSQANTSDSSTIIDSNESSSKSITLNTENYYKEFYTAEENKNISLLVDQDNIDVESISNKFENGYTKLSFYLSSINSNNDRTGRFHNLFSGSTETYNYIPKSVSGYFEQRVVYYKKLNAYIDNIITSANLTVENIYNNGSYVITDDNYGGINLNIEIFTENEVTTKYKYEIVKTTPYRYYSYNSKTVFSPVYDWYRDSYYFQASLKRLTIYNAATNELLAEIKYLK